MAKPDSLRYELITRLATALVAIGVVGVIALCLVGLRWANRAYDRALFDDVATLAAQVYVSDGKVKVNLPPVAQAGSLTKMQGQPGSAVYARSLAHILAVHLLRRYNREARADHSPQPVQVPT